MNKGTKRAIQLSSQLISLALTLVILYKGFQAFEKAQQAAHTISSWSADLHPIQGCKQDEDQEVTLTELDSGARELVLVFRCRTDDFQADSSLSELGKQMLEMQEVQVKTLSVTLGEADSESGASGAFWDAVIREVSAVEYIKSRTACGYQGCVNWKPPVIDRQNIENYLTEKDPQPWHVQEALAYDQDLLFLRKGRRYLILPKTQDSADMPDADLVQELFALSFPEASAG